ncbi:MAG: hypothetical protein ACI4OJ_02950 [Lachnospiraceae bacterium]
MTTTGDRLNKMREALLSELPRVLAFWSSTAWDPKREIFLPIGVDGRPSPDGLRSSAGEAGVLFAYAEAARFAKEQGGEWLPLADSWEKLADAAWRDLTEHFLDREHGGFYELVFADGNTANGEKRTRTQSDVLCALAKYYLLCGREEVLAQARDLWRLLEEHAHGACDDGSIFYNTYCNWEWTPYESGLELETYLHLLTGYAPLADVWPAEEMLLSLSGILDTVLERWIRPDGGLYRYLHIGWKPQQERADRFGDDARAILAVYESAAAIDAGIQSGTVFQEKNLRFLKSQHCLERAEKASVRIAGHVAGLGSDPVYGGVYDRISPTGEVMTDKFWWTQAEAVPGFLLGYRLGGDTALLDAAEGTLRFILRYLKEPGAEWRRRVTREGSPLPPDHPEEQRRTPRRPVRMVTEGVRLIDAILSSES